MVDKYECENDYIDSILHHIMQGSGSDYHFLIARANNKEEKNAIEGCIIEGMKNVLILKSDEKGIVPPFLDRFVAVFRAFNTTKTCDAVKIFPIPCGYASIFNYEYNNQAYAPDCEPLPLHEREYDMFFSGQVFGQNRKQMKSALDRISRFFKCCFHYTDGYAKGLPLAEYNRKMLSSRIAVVPKGATGYDGESMRYFEAVRARCSIITSYDFQNPLHDHWYYEGSPAIIVRDWSQLTPQLVDSMLRRDNLDFAFHEAKKYFSERVDPSAVARYMLSKLESIASA